MARSTRGRGRRVRRRPDGVQKAEAALRFFMERLPNSDLLSLNWDSRRADGCHVCLHPGEVQADVAALFLSRKLHACGFTAHLRAVDGHVQGWIEASPLAARFDPWLKRIIERKPFA